VQLADNITTSRQHIRDAVAERYNIAQESLRDQWQHLVLRPLSKLNEPGPYIIVIDALDECNNDNNIRIIVQLLAEARSLTRARLRVLLTSRPEVPIRHEFYQVPDAEHQDVVLHNIPRSVVDHDIALLLKYNFSCMSKEECLGDGWLGAEVICSLVQKASGLFIWAATAYRFLRQGLIVEERLRILLEGDSYDGVLTPDMHLDSIYVTVLRASVQGNYSAQERQQYFATLKVVIGSIVILFSPLSVKGLSNVLLFQKRRVDRILRDLHAILAIPTDDEQPLRLHHPSFRDFLLDKKRCNDVFCVDEELAHQHLASMCLQLISASGSLHQDMCNLSYPGVFIREISEATIHRNLPPEVQYACRYWVDHLERSGRTIEDGDATHRFLKEHFLHWLEAMSLMRESSRCIHLVKNLHALAEVRSSQNILLSLC
jgi:hypothetical protein